MLKEHESTPALKRKEQKIKIKIKNRRKKKHNQCHKETQKPTQPNKRWKEGRRDEGKIQKRKKKKSQTKTPENISRVDTSKIIFCHPT